MRVVFVGPPGSGKGTQAKLLQERLGMAYIGTGDILREAIQQGTPVGKLAAPFLTTGRLVPDQLVNEIIRERLRRPDRPTRFILDGYPRTVPQAVAFDAVLAELNLGLKAVIHFQIDDEVVVRRLAGRGREDDVEETVRRRLREFREMARDLLEHYRRQGLLHEVSAVDSIDGLYQKITAILQPKAA
jgi:adenylate kinase